MSAEDTKDKADKSPDEVAQDGDASKEDASEIQSDTKKDQGEEGAGAHAANFQDKVDILCDKPLAIYNIAENKAYRAYSKDANKTPLIAIVCQRELVPRRVGASIYNAIINPTLAKLVLHGAVFWPPAKKEFYVFIYFDNLGKPLLTPGERMGLGWKQDEVMSAIVSPMVDILQDFRDKDFVHGAIRPTNMYDGGAQGKPAKIILGDCLSTPPSYAQPSLYEPISRSMADPIARGKGTLADDLYALGASIAVIMRQNDPMAGLSEEDVLKQKILHGSYAAITGKDRFKGEILELLRGLLHDEPGQRWTIDEVLSWLDGRRLSPKQSSALKKAPRPFVMGEDRYLYAKMLAMDVEKQTKEIKKSIEDESLLNWIERSLEDEEVSERFEKAVIDSRQQSTSSGHDSCLVSNISIAFDPDAPLRFKGLCMIGDGIGFAIAQRLALKQPIGAYAEVFLNSLVLNWLSVQNSAVVDVTALFAKFERCRRYMKNSKFGEGVERAVYVLCPESHCLSETVKDYFVTEPDNLLSAYEDLCKQGKAPPTFLDLHAVAFLYEKDQKIIEPYLYDLNTHESHKVIGANLKCLAAIQKRYDMDNMTAISKVMAPRLQVVIKRYHDRRVQEKLKENIVEFQTSGNLVKIAAIFENVEVSKKDFTSFRRAMQEYKNIEKERQILEMKLQDKDKFGIETGKEVSAILSSVLAFIIILGAAFLFFSDKSLF